MRRALSIVLSALAASCALVGRLDDYRLRLDASADADLPPTDAGVEATEAETDAAVPPAIRRSCLALADDCGPSRTTSCCAAMRVVGGEFKRDYDGVDFADASFPATVSDFEMDAFEITVGRFRKFVEAYPESRPSEGNGKNVKNAKDTGWRADWDSTLPPDRAAFENALATCTGTPWTATAGPNESIPMACFTWFEGFAFCAWDGGRLLTNAEWTYAAAGGNEQRVYPWSSPPSSTILDPSYASYGGAAPTVVGSRSPKGDGRWGQSDLSGGIWEMVLDDQGVYEVPCVDCGSYGSASRRIFRGGCAGCNAPDIRVAHRGVGEALFRRSDRGGRCGRNL